MRFYQNVTKMKDMPQYGIKYKYKFAIPSSITDYICTARRTGIGLVLVSTLRRNSALRLT